AAARPGCSAMSWGDGEAEPSASVGLMAEEPGAVTTAKCGSTSAVATTGTRRRSDGRVCHLIAIWVSCPVAFRLVRVLLGLLLAVCLVAAVPPDAEAQVDIS